MIAGYYRSRILAAGQPQGATSIIQAITGEGLAQGLYVAARGGVEPTTFRTKGTDNLNFRLKSWFQMVECAPCYDIPNDS